MNPNRRVNFHVINIEHNPENYSQLQLTTTATETVVTVRNLHTDFSNGILTVLEELDRTPYDNPALFFIDPFGFKDVSQHALIPLIRRPKRELLITLMTYALVRASGMNDTNGQLVRKLCGPIGSTTGALEAQIVDGYCRPFRNEGYYATAIRIQSVDDPAIYYHLVHVTKSIKGLIEMKRAMKAAAIEQQQRRRGQLTLDFYDDFEAETDLEDYGTDLLSRFEKGDYPYFEFVCSELQTSSFDYSDVSKALRELEHKRAVKIFGQRDPLKEDRNAVIRFTGLLEDSSEQLPLF